MRLYVEEDEAEETAFYLVDVEQKAMFLASGWPDVSKKALLTAVIAISKQDSTNIAPNPNWADRVQEKAKEALEGKKVKVVGKDPMFSARHKDCVGPLQLSTW